MFTSRRAVRLRGKASVCASVGTGLDYAQLLDHYRLEPRELRATVAGMTAQQFHVGFIRQKLAAFA